MGKDGDLWDDSALLNAFDDAMFKYKKMHRKKKTQHDSTDGGQVGNGTGEENASATTTVDETLNGTVKAADKDSKAASNTATELRENENLTPAKDNKNVESLEPEPYRDSTKHNHTQTVNGCSDSQGVEDYNQLLSQYYQLEDKKQKVLQQLSQYGGYNYQFPAEGSASGGYLGAYSYPQDQPVAAAQASLSPLISSCCPYACHCSVAPCSSYSTCSLDRTCVGKTCTDSSAFMGPAKSFHAIDGDIVKTAMNAAERAISSMNIKTSVDPDIEGHTVEESKDSDGEIAQTTSSETDLSVVLNAWYSAGFYTGKYLTEQSIAKKRDG